MAFAGGLVSLGGARRTQLGQCPSGARGCHRVTIRPTGRHRFEYVEAAILGHTGSKRPILRTVIIHGAAEDAAPIVLDVFSLPCGHCSFNGFGLAPRALIVARGTGGGGGRRFAILNAVYGLTAAETDIALYLAQGKTAERIAWTRSVAVGTVRSQIKTVLAKVGVSRQAELAVRLSQF